MKSRLVLGIIVLACAIGICACGVAPSDGSEFPHEHEFGVYTYNNDATCISDGTETATCVGCDVKDTRIKTGSLNSNAHKYIDYFCVYCSEFDKNASETTCLIYEDNVDGTCSVVGCADKRIKYVKIPETHDGKSVTKVGSNALAYSDIVYAILPSGITDIRYGAFGYCKSLIGIDIPQSVTSIGSEAFLSCERVKSITLPDGIASIQNDTFKNCAALVEINMPSELVEIGEGAFSGCASLRGEIVVPDGVVGIGQSAFDGCASLTAVSLPEGLARIADKTFYGCESLSSANIPESVQTVGMYAFMNSGLKDLFIPKSVSNIFQDAFRGCGKLESITVAAENVIYKSVDNCLIEIRNKWLLLGCKNSVIPTDGSAASIEWYAFSNIAELTSVEIPSSISRVWGASFYGCDNISSLTVAKGHAKYIGVGNCIIDAERKTLVAGCKNSVIPDDGSIISIGENAFEGCGITELDLPRGITDIGQYAYADCRNLTVIEIGGNVNNIGRCAFYGCSGLTDVIVGDGVKSIGDKAFGNCDGIRRVSVGSGTESIGANAFYMCFALEEAVLGANIKSIGMAAFAYCWGLTRIEIPMSVQIVGHDIFDNCANLTIYCEAASKPDGWQYDWSSGKSVVWDCGTNDKDENGYAFVTVGDVVYGVKNGTACVFACRTTAVGKVVIADKVQYGGDECSVTDIVKYAFYNCKLVTEAHLPNSLLKIERYAFCACDNLNKLVFGGSKEDWGAIDKDEFWGAFLTGVFNIECADGVVDR